MASQEGSEYNSSKNILLIKQKIDSERSGQLGPTEFEIFFIIT